MHAHTMLYSWSGREDYFTLFRSLRSSANRRPAFLRSPFACSQTSFLGGSNSASQSKYNKTPPQG